MSISSSSNWQTKALLKIFSSQIKIVFSKCNNKVPSNAERISLNVNVFLTTKHIIQWTSKTSLWRNKMMGKTNQITVWELQVTVHCRKTIRTPIAIIKTINNRLSTWVIRTIRKQEDIQLQVQHMIEYQLEGSVNKM